MSVAGVWHITIATPIGTHSVVLELSETGGVVAGVAKGAAENTPLIDPVLEGNRLTWAQSVTRPMRLNLTFDVTIDGDTLTGTPKAGMLPASKVAGRRMAGTVLP